jgi:hypothetical protein
LNAISDQESSVLIPDPIPGPVRQPCDRLRPLSFDDGIAELHHAAPNAALDLVNFERQQARVVFGFNF